VIRLKGGGFLLLRLWRNMPFDEAICPISAVFKAKMAAVDGFKAIQRLTVQRW